MNVVCLLIYLALLYFLSTSQVLHFFLFFFLILLNLNLSIYSFGCYGIGKWNCFINSSLKLLTFELLVYKNIIDFLILMLYITTLLNSLLVLIVF